MWIFMDLPLPWQPEGPACQVQQVQADVIPFSSTETSLQGQKMRTCRVRGTVLIHGPCKSPRKSGLLWPQIKTAHAFQGPEIPSEMEGGFRDARCYKIETQVYYLLWWRWQWRWRWWWWRWRWRWRWWWWWLWWWWWWWRWRWRWRWWWWWW